MTLEHMDETQSGLPESQVDAGIAPDETVSGGQFSQEEVNKIVAQAKRETRRAEQSKFSDYENLKARAAKADELEQAQLTETERLQARAEDAERRENAATSEIADALISSDVKVRAAQMGIVDPDAAFVLLDRKGINYDSENGVTGVEDALTALVESKPWLRSNNRTPNMNPEGGQPTPTIKLTQQQRDAARAFGMTEEQYAKYI